MSHHITAEDEDLEARHPDLVTVGCHTCGTALTAFGHNRPESTRACEVPEYPSDWAVGPLGTVEYQCAKHARPKEDRLGHTTGGGRRVIRKAINELTDDLVTGSR